MPILLPFRHLSPFIRIFVALLLLVTNPASAQDNQAETVRSGAGQNTNTDGGNDKFTMNMREADLRAFIQWVADRTGKNILVHRSVQGKVTVISSRPVTPDEAYELFLTVLQLNGFAAVDTDGATKIVPEAEAKSSNIPFSGDEIRKGDIVTALIDIQHIDAAQFVGTLKPLVPASAHMAPYASTNTLIIADTARGIDKIRKLVTLLDKKDGEIDFEIVPIIHASADEIVSVLESVSKALMAGPAGAGNAAQEIEFAVDKRSNSVLLTGKRKNREQMKKVIARLDTPLDGNGNTQVIYLNYATAEDIKPILQSIGDSILKENKTENIKSFSIESDEATNALIISAPPSVMNNMKAVISQLDIQRAQVLIEAVIVQITGNAGDDFGVVWGASDIYETPLDGSVGGVNLSGDTGVGDFAAAAVADGITSEDIAAGVLATNGLTYGYLEDGNLIGALKLITTRSKSNIMSTPSIVALDNEEASLLVGQNVPFITGAATSSGADVTNPFQTIQREDIGITLKVTPRINQGDSITLEIEQTTENVSVAATSQASDLITDKTEIRTSALIKDGEVLVLGGLIREDDVKSRTQLPLLGDIPLLGRLFRSSSVDKTKNNLMVFIRPVILKDRLQVEGLTAQRYAFMRDKQMQRALSSFIKYSDRPVLEEFDVFSPTGKLPEPVNDS